MASSSSFRGARRVTAQTIDGAVARRRGEPGAGTARDAAPRPVFERRSEGVLRAVLGEVPVTGGADERGDDAAPLVAEDRGERRLGRLPVRFGRLRFGRRGFVGTGTGFGHMSQIGRTSIVPTRAPGIFAAISTASSRSEASTTK